MRQSCDESNGVVGHGQQSVLRHSNLPKGATLHPRLNRHQFPCLINFIDTWIGETGEQTANYYCPAEEVSIWTSKQDEVAGQNGELCWRWNRLAKNGKERTKPRGGICIRLFIILQQIVHRIIYFGIILRIGTGERETLRRTIVILGVQSYIMSMSLFLHLSAFRVIYLILLIFGFLVHFCSILDISN